MNTANPNGAAADAVSDESEDLIAELARIVAKDAHDARQDVPRQESKAPPPIPPTPSTAEPPARPAPDPDAILSEGFRSIGEPTLESPGRSAPPVRTPAPAGSEAVASTDGAASPLGRLRPADLGFGTEPAPKPAARPPEIDAKGRTESEGEADIEPADDNDFDFGFTSDQFGRGETGAEDDGAYKGPADDFDPIADIIADAEPAERSEAGRPEPEAPLPAARPTARQEPVAEAAPPAPAPAPQAAAPEERAAARSDRFETPPGMRQKPAETPHKRAASADPLDEIERLIAETTAIEFPSAAAQAAHAAQSAPQPEAPPAAQTTSAEATSAEAASAPEPARKPAPEPAPAVRNDAVRVLDEAAATAEAAIAASVTHSLAGERTEDDVRADAAASAAFSRAVGRLAVPAGAAVLVLALVGGGAWWYFNQDGSPFGEAPVVTAQNTTVKQDPPAIEAAIDAGDPADSIVFTQLSGETGQAPADEQIVSRDQSQSADADSLTRVITPQSDTGGLANRRVRTVTVRADGTIVSGDEATAGVEPLPAVRPNVPDVPGAPAIGDGDADSIGAVLNALAAEEAGTPAQVAASEQAAGQQAAVSTGVGNVAPVPIPRPADIGTTGGQTIVQPRQSASVSDQVTQPRVVTPVVITPAPSAAGAGAPVSLLGEPTTTASIPAAVGNSSSAPYYVQLASQRSESIAIATAEDMGQRFASALAGTTLEVQRADLGAQGVYYRVKAPAQSLGEANALCNQVKASGGDCFVRAD